MKYMTKRQIATAVAVFATINGWILYRAWQYRSGHESVARIEARRLAEQSRLLSDWNSKLAVRIDSEAFPAAVGQIPFGQCFSVPAGGTHVDTRDVIPEQRSDLNLAAVGLLRAYGRNDPNAVIGYMRERGMKMDPSIRAPIEEFLHKRGYSAFESLSDEKIYALLWKAKQCNTRWQSVVTTASCWRVWDASSFSVRTLYDEFPNTSELMSIFQGMMGQSSFFIAVNGGINEASEASEHILVADGQFIVQFDAEMFNENAAYIVRFWYNGHMQKWQPFRLVRISTVASGDDPESDFLF